MPSCGPEQTVGWLECARIRKQDVAEKMTAKSLLDAATILKLGTKLDRRVAVQSRHGSVAGKRQ